MQLWHCSTLLLSKWGEDSWELSVYKLCWILKADPALSFHHALFSKEPSVKAPVKDHPSHPRRHNTPYPNLFLSIYLLCHLAVWRPVPPMAFLPSPLTHAEMREQWDESSHHLTCWNPDRLFSPGQGQSHLGGFSKLRLHGEASIFCFFPK